MTEKLTEDQVEKILEEYQWPIDEREEVSYTWNSSLGRYTYQKTGKIFPAHTVSIVEGDASWFNWQEIPTEGEDVPGLGKVYLEHEFGGEGMGDSYYIVLKIVMAPEHQEHGFVRYFRKDGYHVSHDGSYLDGAFYEVEPKEKKVTVYEQR